MSLLEIKNIKKSFDDHVILKDLSLSVEKGEVIVILGPSGCGKSTLLRCINGLETIQGGEILLDGEVISNRKKDMAKRPRPKFWARGLGLGLRLRYFFAGNILNKENDFCI